MQKCDRQKDMDVLESKLRGTGCIAVIGLAGMGKSVLASGLRFILEQEPEYSGRIIHVDCRENWADDDFYSAIIDALDHALGLKPEKNEAPLEQRIIKLLDNNRIVLFIDDFQWVESERTLSLLSAAVRMHSGRLAVFSRRKPELDPMSGLDVYQHVLKGLTADETGSMIKGLMQYQGKQESLEQAAYTMHSLCAGHPFSLKIMAGLLLTGRMTLDSLKHDQPAFREHIEAYMIDRFWKTLDNRERSLLEKLSVLDIPIPSALLCSKKEDKTAVSRLRDWCLIEQDIQGRIWSHDLVREFVRNLMTAEEKNRVNAGIAAILFSNAGADALLLEESYYRFVDSGLLSEAENSLIRLCRVNLFLVTHRKYLLPILEDARKKLNIKNDDLDLYMTRMMIDTGRFEQAEKSNRFSGWKKRYLQAELSNARFNYREALDHYSAGASACDDQEMKLLMLMKAALLTGYSGKDEDAVGMFERIGLDHDLSDHELIQPLYYHYFTNALLLAARDRKALECCERAEQSFKKLNARGRLQEVYYYKSICLTNLEDLDGSEKALNQSISYCRDTGDFKQMATCFSTLANLYYNKNMMEESIEAYKKVLVLAQPQGRYNIMAYVCARMGNIFHKTEKLKDATHFFNSSMLYLDKTADQHTKSNVISLYAPFLVLTGKMDEAIPLLEGELQSIDNPRIRADFLNVLKHAYRLIGDPEKLEQATEEYCLMLSKMPQTTQEFLFSKQEWFEKKVKMLLNSVVVLEKNRPQYRLTVDELVELRKEAQKYDIFADFTTKYFLVDGQEISLGKRRRLAQLFLEMAQNPGIPCRITSIYKAVWEREYDHASDANTFRANISRLRNVLDRDNRNRFIVASEDGNAYLFKDSVNYCCVIEPPEASY